VAEDRQIHTHGGTAVPVRDPRGSAWGGCWFELRPTWTTTSLVIQLLPWFLISTLLLTLATFHALRRVVLEPVELLARGSRRLASGDLSVRLPEPRRHDEIAELVRSFNRMAGEVHGFGERLAREVDIATDKARRAEAVAMTHRRLSATGELAAGIAHEINNPLGGMMNAVEVLGREDLDAEKRARYLELLAHGLERIRATVGRVLRLAPRVASVEAVDLARPLGDAVGLLRHRLRAESIELVVASRGAERGLGESDWHQILEGLPTVEGSGGELAQVALNLIGNSIDAIALHETEERRHGHIRVSIEPGDHELLWRFEDDGPGLEPEALGRAADAFFTTKEAGKGTGLGLAIVHNVITAHGGRVELSSEVGRGFRVDVHLPVRESLP
jgi:signal transduction histidine kinase